MQPLPVLHVSAWRENRGGIQSTLAQHHARDAGCGLASRFVSVFDRAATWGPDCASLAAHGWMTVGAVRRRFAAAAAGAGSVAIYHDGWGLDWFSGVDGADRRLVYLHTERPHADELLRRFEPQVDGFLCVSRGFADRVRRVLPGFPEERICALPFFLEPPPWVAGLPDRAEAGRPLRLGYAGRVDLGHKRLDRLPALVAALDRRGLDFVFEVAGEGDHRVELQRRLAGDARVRFCGWLTGEPYWRKLAEWDLLVLLSDYEGFSRVTMEAMSCGVLPVHPDFSPAAAELLGPAAAPGLYPTGDMEAAADRIAAMARLDAAAAGRLRRACRAHLAGNTSERYGRTVADFARRIGQLPRRGVAAQPSLLLRSLPLGACTRLLPRRF